MALVAWLLPSGFGRLSYILSPHSLQNFEPGVSSVPQFAHLPGAAAFIGEPQLLQNFTPCAFSSPQVWQRFLDMEAPQLLQNFPVPEGLPQTGQTVV